MNIEKRKPDFKEVWIWYNKKPTQVNIWQVSHNNGQYCTNHIEDLNGKTIKSEEYGFSEEPGYKTKEELIQEKVKPLNKQKEFFLDVLTRMDNQIKQIEC